MSPAFPNDSAIPDKYTGEGKDLSPPLTWSNAPERTVSLALICDDPDAPSHANPRPESPWVHWVVFNIPANVTQLPEGMPRKARLESPVEACQGVNDFTSNNIGYRGPMPPRGSGPHRYRFQIYALDCTLDLDPAHANKQSLLKAIEGHVLAQGEWTGIFER